MHSDSQNEMLLVGIDWADQKHDVCVRLLDDKIESLQIDADTDDVERLVERLQKLAHGRPIAICLEKSRVRIIYHLMLRDNIQLYLIDPKQIARYRESFTSSGAKDDPGDAALILRFLSERHDQLRVWKPDDAQTRRISQFCHTRRSLVDNRTGLIQELQSVLKTYNPLVLSLAGGNATSAMLSEILRRWPDPRRFKRNHPETLRKLFRRHGIKNTERIDELIQMVRSKPLVTSDRALLEPLAIRAQAIAAQIEVLDKAIQQLEEEIDKAMQEHPDGKLFKNLPGAGKALAPRLLAAFGSQRDRFKSAEEIAVYSGIAPVTRQSGKTKHVSRRRACPKYLRQTFHEFADCARKWCPWSRAFYQLQRDRGMKHHAAVRKLAYKWIRILYPLWKNRTSYDPNHYLNSLKAKNHPLLCYLERETSNP